MRRTIAADRLNDWADLACLVEAACWISAWLVLPAWLGWRGAGIGQYAIYAAGAGSILAAGVIGTNPGQFRSDRCFAGEFTLAAVLAVTLIGGAVFALVGWLAPWAAGTNS
ncbi:hypothetical protein E2493_09190 [Sphingomonas parva]|uniref:Uncharacterized protein n=1 Tax=Sphingomonas parva TaxID=2555898 RepID=A0A4Y8ZV16_9SPHN|nr:hypothetical protein [Sphingomonas parva]TFI58589.1 hypothetical protein E2493_09190 [Sphingomonas parva]